MIAKYIVLILGLHSIGQKPAVLLKNLPIKNPAVAPTTAPIIPYIIILNHLKKGAT